MPKSQHEPAYRPAPPFLRQPRERAGLTQRALGQRLRRPQSWVYSCETANRRVDVAEFALWCKACALEPTTALAELLASPAGTPCAAAGSKRRRPNR